MKLVINHWLTSTTWLSKKGIWTADVRIALLILWKAWNAAWYCCAGFQNRPYVKKNDLSLKKGYLFWSSLLPRLCQTGLDCLEFYGRGEQLKIWSHLIYHVSFAICNGQILYNFVQRFWLELGLTLLKIPNLWHYGDFLFLWLKQQQILPLQRYLAPDSAYKQLNEY